MKKFTCFKFLAAHCVTKNENVINSSKIVIYLGKYHQLQYSDELGVQTKQVRPTLKSLDLIQFESNSKLI